LDEFEMIRSRMYSNQFRSKARKKEFLILDELPSNVVDNDDDDVDVNSRHVHHHDNVDDCAKFAQLHLLNIPLLLVQIPLSLVRV